MTGKKINGYIEGDLSSWADVYVAAYNAIDEAVATLMQLEAEMAQEPGMQEYWTGDPTTPATEEQEGAHALFVGIQELAKKAKQGLDDSKSATDKDMWLTRNYMRTK